MNGEYVYAVYDHPLDFPDDFVVRKFSTSTNEPDKELTVKSKSLVEIHQELTKMKLVYIGRMQNDDPVIIECWI